MNIVFDIYATLFLTAEIPHRKTSIFIVVIFYNGSIFYSSSCNNNFIEMEIPIFYTDKYFI